MEDMIRKVLEEIVGKLERNPEVLAITVFGSAIHGEMWEHSDLDMMAILSDREEVAGAAYLPMGERVVHLQYLTKNRLESILTQPAGPFHQAFGTGNLLLCRDTRIAELFRTASRTSAGDFGVRLTESLGALLSDLYQMEKMLALERLDDATVMAFKVLEQMAIIGCYLRGQFPKRDVFSQDDIGKELTDALASLMRCDDNLPRRLFEVKDYVDQFINENLEVLSQDLLDYLSCAEHPLTVVDLERSERYSSIRTNFERILDCLERFGLVVKRLIPFELPGLEEKVGEQIAYERKS